MVFLEIPNVPLGMVFAETVTNSFETRSGRASMHALFLKIAFVQEIDMCVHACVCMCVCPPLRLLVTNGVMWHDLNSI